MSYIKGILYDGNGNIYAQQFIAKGGKMNLVNNEEYLTSMTFSGVSADKLSQLLTQSSVKTGLKISKNGKIKGIDLNIEVPYGEKNVPKGMMSMYNIPDNLKDSLDKAGDVKDLVEFIFSNGAKSFSMGLTVAEKVLDNVFGYGYLFNFKSSPQFASEFMKIRSEKKPVYIQVMEELLQMREYYDALYKYFKLANIMKYIDYENLIYGLFGG
jgi:hypothetical protein